MIDKHFSIGLTGGIGSGKSLVADMFAALGAALIDTDLIAHQLTVPGGAAMPLIAAQFGAGEVDARLSRRLSASRDRDNAGNDAGASGDLCWRGGRAEGAGGV